VTETAAATEEASAAPRPLTAAEASTLDRYWRAANYLAVGQIYLMANSLLAEPLRPEHVKPRLLGHWGTSPGLNFVQARLACSGRAGAVALAPRSAASAPGQARRADGASACRRVRLRGLTRGMLTSGAASLVFYRDGRVDVGVRGPALHLTSQVAGVRQNLRPIVDHGVVPATVDTNIESGWGATLGGGYYVWRSGVGITRDGRVVYVYGPALSVRTLADLLRRAGCVEAMQLDINPAWMSFMYYRPGHHPADPTPVNLLPGQQQPAGRYYEPSSRDFTAVYAR
jgi:XFP N-terminal domain/Phosphodiester glycosidase